MTDADEVIAAKTAAIRQALRSGDRQRGLMLLAALGIDRAMLAACGRKADPLAQRDVPVLDPQGRERREMLARLAEALGCRALLHAKSVRVPGEGGQSHAAAVVTLAGHESDIARSLLLFEELLPVMRAEMRGTPRDGMTRGRHARSFTLAWGPEAAADAARAEAAMRKSATAQSAAGKAPAGMAVLLRNRAAAVAEMTVTTGEEERTEAS
jgi:hypothetical protein